MSEIINGYKLIGELTNARSGFAKWGFARKDGIDVFIKEFLSPVYPIDGTTISQEQLRVKRQICNEFEQKKRRFYAVLNKCSTGNVITILDIFRWKSKYYIVTEKVNAKAISAETISEMSTEQKIQIAKIVTHCVNSLHKNGIVHGDIKADNILLKETQKGFYTAKLIDFDASFFEGDASKADEEFQGDMVYLAPESFLYIAGRVSSISSKIDVFALGVLFHQYFTGKVPGFDATKYAYAFEAVLDDNELLIDGVMPQNISSLIKDMLKKEPVLRPRLDEVFTRLSAKDKSVEINTEKQKEIVPPIEMKNVLKTEVDGKGYFKKADDLW